MVRFFCNEMCAPGLLTGMKEGLLIPCAPLAGAWVLSTSCRGADALSPDQSTSGISCASLKGFLREEEENTLVQWADCKTSYFGSTWKHLPSHTGGSGLGVVGSCAGACHGEEWCWRCRGTILGLRVIAGCTNKAGFGDI